MAYLLTSAAIDQSGIDLTLAGNVTMVDGKTLGLTDAILTFDSSNSVVSLTKNLGLATGQGVVDENNNNQILFTTTATAVNYIDIGNAAAAGTPNITADGSDSNIDLDLKCKGTGNLNIGQGSFSQTEARIWGGSSGTFYVGQGSSSTRFCKRNPKE